MAVKLWPGVLLPDWSARWHAPLIPLAQQVWEHWQAEGGLCQALNACQGRAGVRFVPQAELPPGVAYEQHIFDTRRVPTRSNLHDFYNGLMWLHFPQAKLRLNALQGAELARQSGVGSTRGPLRDALTLFDENVLLLQAPDAVWQALAWKRWPELFGALRPLWADCRLVLFGHAALEQLAQPFRGITAHVYRIPCHVAADMAAWDNWLSQALHSEHLQAKPFAHLPLLGVPGWCADNDDPAYYHDAGVFRPLRRLPSAAVTGA